MKRHRPLFAAIFPAVHDDCQSIVWPGVADFAAENDIDLITFVATSQNKVATFEPHYDIVASLTQGVDLDGLLIYTGAFSDHFDTDSLKVFCTSLNRCPVVCIHQKVAGIKSILINNTAGVEQAVAHLIEEHNCRQFAFVKGHENHTESEERFRAFCNELERHNLSLPGERVYAGHFIKESGIKAAQKMIGQGALPDAVMAVNDSTALGLIAEFGRHNIRVPGDIRVVGFDDVPEARNHVPSLTTVSQPLYAIGKTAARELLAITRGEGNETDFVMSTDFVARQSCGCIGRHIADSGLKHDNELQSQLETVRSRKQFVDYCAQLLVTDGANVDMDVAATWVDDLIEALKEDIRASEAEITPEHFVERLAFNMVQHISANGSATVWQQVLTGLAAKWRSLIRAAEFAPVVEDIFSRSRMCVSDFVLRMNLTDELVKDDSRAFIRNIMLSLITAFDLDRVKNVLKENLPIIGIRACHLVLYGSGRESVSIDRLRIPRYSKLVLSFNEDGVIVDVGDFIKFETRSILPAAVWSTTDRKDHLLFPIVFERRNYGYVLFQRAKDLPHYVYEELRIHIGNALRGHNLVNELREMSLRDELTGLYNRRGFTYLGNHMISQAKRLHSPVTIMYGDMDKLKYINDTFGHGEGDFAIAKTAELLKNNIRDQDIVARIGGDEFAIIAVNLDDLDCQGVLKRIQDAFDSFNKTSVRSYQVSISIGFTQRPDASQTSIGELLEDADQMLGKIKRGR